MFFILLRFLSFTKQQQGTHQSVSGNPHQTWLSNRSPDPNRVRPRAHIGCRTSWRQSHTPLRLCWGTRRSPYWGDRHCCRLPFQSIIKYQLMHQNWGIFTTLNASIRAFTYEYL